MKKTFTILFSMVVSAFAMAQERVNLATMTFPDALTDENGTITGTGCEITYTNVSATETAKLSGKVYHKMTENSSSIRIALTDGELRSGDVVSIHFLNDESRPQKVGFFVKTTTTGSNKSESATDPGSDAWVSYTLTDEDLNEDGSVTIIRGSAYKYDYVRELSVEGEERKIAEQPTKLPKNSEKAGIAIEGRTIRLATESDVKVFSLSGALVFAGKTQQVTTPSKGIYIVVMGDARIKVTVN